MSRPAAARSGALSRDRDLIIEPAAIQLWHPVCELFARQTRNHSRSAFDQGAAGWRIMRAKRLVIVALALVQLACNGDSPSEPITLNNRLVFTRANGSTIDFPASAQVFAWCGEGRRQQSAQCPSGPGQLIGQGGLAAQCREKRCSAGWLHGSLPPKRQLPSQREIGTCDPLTGM